MESPGEFLKRERGIRGVPLSKIFDSTRVPMKYLQALEADDYDSLPHPTFVKGYIKSYCKALGLDETDTVLRYEVYLREKQAESNPPQPVPEPVQKETPRERRIELPRNTRNIIIYASVGIVIIVILFLAASGRKDEPRRPAPVAENAAPLSPPAVVPATQVAPVAPVQTGEQAQETPKPAVAAPEKKAAPVEQPAVASAPVKPKTSDKDNVAAAGQTKENKHSLLVSAKETTWIKVRIDEGEPFDVLLKEGESIVWKASDLFYVVVGNAGGVTMVYDGKKLPPLGQPGQVVNFNLPRVENAHSEARKPAKPKAERKLEEARPAEGSKKDEPQPASTGTGVISAPQP